MTQGLGFSMVKHIPSLIGGIDKCGMVREGVGGAVACGVTGGGGGWGS